MTVFPKMVWICNLITLFVSLSIHFREVEAKNISVTTQLGTLNGFSDMVEFDSQWKPVQRFLGIPFAKPPVGKRRFARPEPFGNFEAPYNATFHRPHCLQIVPPYYIHLAAFEKSEDCLYLNLYIPGNTTSTANKYPVMIYIYGGSFALGGADIYSGDILSAFNDVIVVTFNYRLNVFGFLSNGSRESGNFGLWDTRLAVQWVHDHIQEFGGDPARVTLFGNSAGGAAITYMSAYPKNRGLFQRAIDQSGTFMAYWAFQPKPVEVFVDYVRKLGCYNIDNDVVLNCLRGKTAEELQTGSWYFLPSLDGEFIPEAPDALLSGKSIAGKSAMEFFSEIDYIFGVTSKDGAYVSSSWEQALKQYKVDIAFGIPRTFFETAYVPATLPLMTGGLSSKEAIKSAIFQYIDWTKPDDPIMIRNTMVEFQSDVDFYIPAAKVMQKHSEMSSKLNTSSSNYFYVFNHKPSFVPYPSWLDGATHTMDVPYCFGIPKSLERKLIDDQGASNPIVRLPEDIMLSKTMMKMWTNFAKTGNPNTIGAPNWPKYNTDQQLYLEIGVNMTQDSVKDYFVATRVAFWTKLIPELGDCEKCKQCSNVASSAVKIAVSVYTILLSFIVFI